MSNSTISTVDLFEMFPSANHARDYLTSMRWPDGAVCPACNEVKRVGKRMVGIGDGVSEWRGFYRCYACRTDFTVRTGTIFERSPIPLHKWLYAMHLLVTAPKGISSVRLAKEIGVTQKTALFVIARLRADCGKEGEKHASKRLNLDRGGIASARC